jgi:REP element-mobilizing transposase RayT
MPTLRIHLPLLLKRGFAAFRSERLCLSGSDPTKGGYTSCSVSRKTHQFITSLQWRIIVIMPDHLHALIGSERDPSDVLRYVNGIRSHLTIHYLKERGFESSLQKLRHATGLRKHKYSLWNHHPNLKLITTENGLMEKANYIHQNPVRAGLVECAEDYRWSSIRYWQRKPLEDEPLRVDIDQIHWHKP